MNRMLYSLPINLLVLDVEHQDIYSTVTVPHSFNLYDTYELKGKNHFKRLDFWHEYHCLKSIAVNSTTLCKSLIFPNLKEADNILC